VLVLDMIEILIALGKYKYDTWKILLVKGYIDNSVCLCSCIQNVNNPQGFDHSRIRVLMGGAKGVQHTSYTPYCETLAAAASQSNSECLAAPLVLAHSHAAFYPCTYGLRGGAVAVATALIGYDNKKVAAKTSTIGGNHDRLLPLHQRVTTLDRYSNSSSAAQRV
jgi:hypothetical protein